MTNQIFVLSIAAIIITFYLCFIVWSFKRICNRREKEKGVIEEDFKKIDKIHTLDMCDKYLRENEELMKTVFEQKYRSFLSHRYWYVTGIKHGITKHNIQMENKSKGYASNIVASDESLRGKLTVNRDGMSCCDINKMSAKRINIKGCSRDFGSFDELSEYIVYLEKLAGINKQ